MRTSPQARHTAKILEVFTATMNGMQEPAQAAARLESLTPPGGCDGYWHGVAGMQVTVT